MYIVCVVASEDIASISKQNNRVLLFGQIHLFCSSSRIILDGTLPRILGSIIYSASSDILHAPVLCSIVATHIIIIYKSLYQNDSARDTREHRVTTTVTGV